jgi:hypothetical protein
MSADLTRIRQVSEEIAPLAKRYPHWEPVLRYASAEYHRVVRDPIRACAELERVLATTAAGLHQIWIHAATAYVSALVEAGRPREAYERGRALAVLAERELGYLSEHLQIALATALAYSRDATAAALMTDATAAASMTDATAAASMTDATAAASMTDATAAASMTDATAAALMTDATAAASMTDASDPASMTDAAIERLRQAGVAGLRLGSAYEARARIALRLEDTAGFARHAELCRELYMAHKNSALIARYHRLVQDGSRRLDGVNEPLVGTPESVAQYGGSRVELALASCRDDEQRARLALTILIRQSGAVAGLYFGISEEGPVCLAQLGGAVASPGLVERVRACLAQHAAGSVTTHTQTGAESELEEIEIVDEAGRVYGPILIRHFEQAHAVVTGIAVLRPAEHQSLGYPGEAAIAISRYLSSHGATSLMLLADE